MRRQKPCSRLIGSDKQPCNNPGTVSCSRCERAAHLCNKLEVYTPIRPIFRCNSYTFDHYLIEPNTFLYLDHSLFL